MKCSIELWLLYLPFVFKCVIRLVSPSRIFELERLGRALFSGHVKKTLTDPRILPNAFMVNRKSESGISTNRISLAPLRLFSELGDMSAAEKSARQGRVDNFYGFAAFDGGVPQRIKLEDGFALLPKGIPTRSNPFHADIRLPPDRKKDYYLFIATELVRYSKFTR
ncbi:MAG: hypothetical protein HW373_1419 [Deltaproteobacteria bacterium]|nr:hypothetical protein [Deltaproteobacteria bacterium]